MRSVLPAVLGAILAALCIAPAHAQTASRADSVESGAAAVYAPKKKNVGLAVQEMLLANVAVNRFNAWLLNEDWAIDVDAESWSRNLDLGWEWDENQFSTNMFAHPYQGSFYFNAGRSNGLSYWESVPLAFAGSWTWEYFGETHRPAINDFFMTSFGGPSFGEMAYRISATIRDEQARGAERIARETAALLVNPVEGFTRLVGGKWTGLRPNPPEHRRDGLFLGVNVGARDLYEDSGEAFDISPTILVDVAYGDAFQQPYSEPFDVFSLLAQISVGGGVLNTVQTSGRLYQTGLPWDGKRARYAFGVDHRFDYLNNPVYRYGAQSVEAGLLARFALPKGFTLRSQVAGSVLMLGAISAPDVPLPGVPAPADDARGYDFGPGLGAVASAALVRGGTYLALYNRVVYIHSVSGTPANHVVAFTGLKGNLPVYRGLGVGFYLSGDARASRYADRPEIDGQFIETRLFLSWSSASPLTAPGVR